MLKTYTGYLARNGGAFMVFLACLTLSVLLLVPQPSHAQFAGYVRQENSRDFGNVTAVPGSAYTNATTTPTVVTGDTVTASTINDPGELQFQNSSLFVPETLQVWWTVNIKKGTGTTGSCQIYLNGNAVARTVNTWGFGSATAQGDIGGYVELSKQAGDPMNTGSGTQTQTVAVYCYSADTSTVTVNAYSLKVREAY